MATLARQSATVRVMQGPSIWLRIRLWLCRWPGWHSVDLDEPTPVDSIHYPDIPRGECRLCGYRGLVDSQGNLF